MNTEVIAEIYASQGALLNTQIEEVRLVVSNYLQALERAGKEIITDMRLSEETKKLLERKFIPDEIYIEEAKKYVNNMLKK